MIKMGRVIWLDKKEVWKNLPSMFRTTDNPIKQKKIKLICLKKIKKLLSKMPDEHYINPEEKIIMQNNKAKKLFANE